MPRKWKKSRKVFITRTRQSSRPIYNMTRQYLGKKPNLCLISRLFKNRNKNKNKLAGIIQSQLFNIILLNKNKYSLKILILCLLSNGSRLLNFLRKVKNKRPWKCYYKWTMISIFWGFCSNMARISWKTWHALPPLNCLRKCYQSRRLISCNKCYSKWLVRLQRSKLVNFWQTLRTWAY